MRSYIIAMICEALNNILPQTIASAIKFLNADKLYELRIRGGKPVSVGYGRGYYYLARHGTTDSPDNALIAREEDVREIVMRACDKSLYAVNDRICAGFITVKGGIRIGISGETVFEGNRIKTVKNFTAVNVRIPHEVIGCAESIINSLRSPHGYFSALIVSPPGAGKTTLLRDLARLSSSDKQVKNVLIADARDEIAASYCGKNTLNVGINSDVVSACTKEYAFINAVRAMRPDIIVTDELCGESDVAAVVNAIASGVCVFASVHADSHMRLADMPVWESALKNKSFKRFIDVSARNGPGTVDGIYDENFVAVR